MFQHAGGMTSSLNMQREVEENAPRVYPSLYHMYAYTNEVLHLRNCQIGSTLSL